jgi:hypothetical protein
MDVVRRAALVWSYTSRIALTRVCGSSDSADAHGNLAEAYLWSAAACRMYSERQAKTDDRNPASDLERRPPQLLQHACPKPNGPNPSRISQLIDLK